ncbi:MAG: recombinase family protein [Bacteroidetes bacterium]|nr:recombinase family protein [Bacteroidota bacterium]
MSKKVWEGGGIPFGYEYDKENTRLNVNKNESEILKKIFKLAASGYGVSKIADFLNSNGMKPRRSEFWSGQTITYLLHPNRISFYTGFDDNGKPGSWTALLTKSIADKIPIRERLSTPSKKQGVKSEYLLSGIDLTHCGHCGGRIKSSVTIKPNKKNVYYVCSRRQASGMSTCNAKLHRSELINELVLGDLRTKLASDLSGFIEKVREKKFEWLKNKFDIDSRKLNEIISGSGSKADIFNAYQKEANRMVEELEEFEYSFSDDIFPVVLPSNTFAQQRRVLKRNIAQVLVYDEYIEIQYKFPINMKGDFVLKLSLV